MKTRFTWLGIVATIIAGVGLFFAGCNGDVNSVVLYHGQVVYINTTTPFADLTVKVTDGQNTHCQTQTDAGGLFSLKVRVDEIDGSYYLLAGDSTCVPKKVALGGFGQAEVDLGVIEVEGPALPTVVTTPIQSVTADAATLGGEVQADGRLAITARGVCYGTNQQPTIDGMHTTDGIGKGVFTSNLRDLEHNTIYYARAYATNRMGTAYGEQVKFTTELGVPIVITDSVVRITAHTAKCKGHVESDGGYAVSKRGTCWSKRPDPTVDDDCTDDGSGIGEFTSTLKDLQESTTYYVRTYATNSTSTVYGEQIIITTLDGLAVVKTDSITSITATGFTAYGTVVSDCDIPVTARGICYSTTQYPTIDDKHTTASKGLGNYRSIITGLEYATTYYVRAYATNATATVYGEQKEIKTLTGLPSVTTDSVTNIGSVKATCGGNVTDDGSLSVTARGVCYGTEPQPSIEDAHTTDGKGKGKFTSNLKNLQDKTTYYIRAYATTAAGTAYGAQRTFKTEDGTPIVLLKEIGEPTANSVTCKGEVTGDGGVTVTERGFCYGLTQYPTTTDTHVAIGNGIGEFTGSLTGLNVNTTYYIRAYAVNSLGVGYSAQQTFTTKDGLATITTTEPTSTATTISVGGDITDNGGYAVTERGVCYSASNSEPTVIENKVIGGKGNGTFSVSITGLSASTTYHIRAYALNENGITYGETKSIQTKDGNATVALGEIDNITALTASSSVIVSDAGGATLQSCGICWSTNPNPTITDNKTIASGKSLNTSYTCNLSELQPNTNYYVRGFATTDVTTTYSTSKTFKTTIGLPTISTGYPSAEATIITLTGQVTGNGGYNVTERGVCYSKSNVEPTITDSKVVCGSGNGSYEAKITNLEASTTYYLRAYATNEVGTSYGRAVSAETKNGKATVKLGGNIFNVTKNAASATLSVSDAGGATLQSCGICWSTTQSPTISDNKTEATGKQLNTTYTCNMSSLLAGTTYYIRAYATTNIATVYSEAKIFTTPIDITGTVKNESGQAISNATVTFKQGSTVVKSVTSNSNGTFMTELVSGSYNVEVTAQGYNKLSKEVHVDSNPIELVMKPLGVLTGKVYDDDNIPLANAKVTVKSSENTTLTSITDSDGTYRIENIPLGQTSSIACALSGYSLVSSIPNRTIISGDNNLDIQMIINNASACDISWLSFTCSYDGMCGTTVTKTFKIQNNRQKAVSWSMSGIPSKGIKFSSTTGSIPAKSSMIVTATFTYPGPSVAGSTKTTLSGCRINNKTAYTYIWSWANCEPYSMNVCCMGCIQEVSVVVGNNAHKITLQFNQEVAWY